MSSIDPRFANYGEDIVEYLERNARTPGAMLRILQRLHLPLPRTPEDTSDTLLRYFAERGTLEFKARMGLIRAAPASAPAPEPPAVAAGPTARPAPAPAPPAPAPPAPAARTSTSPAPAPSSGAPASDLPEVLRGFPRQCITPEALAAAREGKSPFGPPPLLERRSGHDRRYGGDRRANVELVFRNQRWGRDRRSGKERRRNPAPLRPVTMPVGEATGSEALRRAGWVPPEAAVAAEAKKKKLNE